MKQYLMLQSNRKDGRVVLTPWRFCDAMAVSSHPLEQTLGRAICVVLDTFRGISLSNPTSTSTSANGRPVYRDPKPFGEKKLFQRYKVDT